MSLTREQKQRTIEEFEENLQLLGLSYEDVAEALGGTPSYVGRVAHLRARCLEDPWVLRNYLLRCAMERGIELRPFTALAGDYRDHWFLDGAYIDRGRLG